MLPSLAKSKRAGARLMPSRSNQAISLLRRHDLVVAMRPAEADEIVAHRLGQVAHGAIGIDAERAVALGQLGAVGAVDQRDVRHHRHRPAERVVEDLLAPGVGEVIVAADDVGDAHVVVVDDDGEHVGRRAVGAQDDEIVEVLVGEGDAALHAILDHGLAVARRLDADRRRRRRPARPSGRGRASGRRSAASAPRPAPWRACR